MKVLVINSGSSSIKYRLFDMTNGAELATGDVQRIGEPEGLHAHRVLGSDGKLDETVSTQGVASHREGLERIVAVMGASGAVRDPSELFGIGHRVVHGGEAFREPTLIDRNVLERIRAMVPLAPLHNPANIMGIEVSLQVSPQVPQVAVFDTAFHQAMPPHAYHYALPFRTYSEHHVRRYGFHGTSHRYVAKQAASHLGRPLESLNLITLHLGNGASAAAVRGGRSVDTSMGMTPLEGLIMGTRCGDIDPAIHFYLGTTMGMSSQELESLLNKESGLKGICGANDMREVHRLADSGDERAQLALDMYCYRIKKYIGAYCAVLGQVDAIIFTGGIGENDPWVRERACEGLSSLGIMVDGHRNSQGGAGTFAIQNPEGTVDLLVIPTNEELEIALQTVARIQAERSHPAAPGS